MTSSASPSGPSSNTKNTGSVASQTPTPPTGAQAASQPTPGAAPPIIALGPAGSVQAWPALDQEIGALDRLGAAGRAAVKRIKQVQQNPASFPAYSIHSFLDPVGVEIAIEHEKTQGSGFQRLGVIRNMLILVPLCFTWLGLSLATSAYQNDIRAHPTDVNYPFLALWQQNFGVEHPLLGVFGTFTAFAFIDSILFFAMIALGFLIDRTNGLARRTGEQARELLDVCVQALTAYSIGIGGNVNAQSDPSQWAAFVHQRLQETAVTLNQVSQEIQALQQTAATLGSQASGLGTQAVTLGMRANELGVEAGKLTGAVGQIQGSATQMATAATGMTSAAGAMANSSRDVASATGSMVIAQNKFTADMNVAITGMATRTETAVRGMTTTQGQATQALDRLTQQYTGTANNVANAAGAIRQTMAGLDQRLDQTRRAMDHAADQVVKTAALIRRAQRGGGGFFDWLFGRTPTPTQPAPQPYSPIQLQQGQQGAYFDPNAQTPPGMPGVSRQGHQGRPSSLQQQQPRQPGENN